MVRFVDPRMLDRRPPEQQLFDWDPLRPPLSPTIFQCTRCGHEAHTAAVA